MRNENLPKIPTEKKRTITLIIGLIIVMFLLEQFGLINIITSPLQKVLEPAQIALYKTKQDLAGFVGTLVEIKDLRERESQLAEENNLLLAENAGLKKLESENEVLREQLGAKKVSEKLTVAQVIGQDPLISTSELLIDKGASDEISKGDLVIIKDVLIGEVTSVGSSSSVVRLLADSATKVPAQTQSGVKGILRGKFGNRIILDKVVQGQKLRKGEIVFSSGEADFPKGLVLGKISKVEKTPAALFQKAEVAPLLAPGSLDTVFIVGDEE
ncbi:MAG TPA: rod shape-determining protein MreC [Candidatus Nanoarchaeia archaeon]